jgi:hypothetical protein
VKKTVIIGATNNKARYAYRAAEMLAEYNIEFVPVGIKSGEVIGKPILDLRKLPVVEDVDTVTLYINATHQPMWYNYILSLTPRRVIFNPGTENETFELMLEENHVEAVEACTLVLLRSGQF